jgi:uncharacterized protein DUF6378
MLETVADSWSRAVLRSVGRKPRADILAEVRDVVKDREARYGPPAEHWARTIGAINALFSHKLREPFEVSDWPVFMVLDKLAREMNEPGHDNAVDVIGYMVKRDELDES